MSDLVNFETTNGFEIKSQDELSTWISQCISNYNKTSGEITYIFCSDDYLLDINKKHLEHDYYTDIVTFDYCEGDIISGDLFISTDRIKENAEALQESFEDELHRVMIHGILHLLGHQDKTEEQATQMRKAEETELAKRLWKR